MTPVEKGKYCALCEKTVIDFSGMSDAQLVAFFRSHTGNMCGRFAKDQLDRSIEIPRKRIPWLRYFFQVAIPAFLVTAKAAAQGKVRVGVETHVLNRDTTDVPVKDNENEKKKGRVVTGLVTDSVGNPIAGATVHLMGTRIGTSTRSDGRFQLEVGTNGGHITVSSITYASKIIDITTNKEDLYIQLDESTIGLVGEYIIVKPRRKKPIDLIPEVKPDDAMLKVYPNPARAGSSINIAFDSLKGGYYNVELFDASGKRNMSISEWIDEDARVIDVAIPLLKKGNYVVRVGSKDGKEVFTARVVLVD